MQVIIPHKSILFVLILALGLWTTKPLYGQSNNAEAALYNIGIGSVFSGIGAMINKKPDERYGNVLLKGMAQGALGGYLVYESKLLVGKVADQQKLEINWGAKFVNSAGVSIIENAASNRNFWEQWNFHIGFNRIEFHTDKKFRVKYQIMPAALIAISYAAVGNKFELQKSLQTGEFIFSDNNVDYSKWGFIPAGTAVGPAIIMNTDYLDNYNVYSHELVHVFQYYDFNVVNPYFIKPLDYLNRKSGFFNKMDKLFYYDLQAPFGAILYRLGGDYRDNFIEREAYYYSN